MQEKEKKEEEDVVPFMGNLIRTNFIYFKNNDITNYKKCFIMAQGINSNTLYVQ